MHQMINVVAISLPAQRKIVNATLSIKIMAKVEAKSNNKYGEGFD